MENNGKLIFCKSCHNAIYETIDDMPYLYCIVLKKYIGFYKEPCEHFQ